MNVVYYSGSSDNVDNFYHNQRGIIPRSFEYLFALIQREHVSHQRFDYIVFCIACHICLSEFFYCVSSDVYSTPMPTSSSCASAHFSRSTMNRCTTCSMSLVTDCCYAKVCSWACLLMVSLRSLLTRLLVPTR
jgi:hypothetical protein